MYVVFGAGGRAGGETARALIDGGVKVRVVLRRPDLAGPWIARSAEVALAGMDDAEAVAAALHGASGAFLLNPPPVAGDPFARAGEIGAALAEGARRAGLPKAVVLSSIGAQHASGTGVIATLNRIEALLEGAAPAVAFLRPGYFVETWSEVAEAAIADGVLPSFLDPDRGIPMVSTIDVGRAAADLMREDWNGKRVVELCGPQDWSASDVADAFAEVLGRPVAPALVPPGDRAAVLAAAGLPAEVAAALLGMYDGLASGRVGREHGAEQRRGTVSLGEAVGRIVTQARAAA